MTVPSIPSHQSRPIGLAVMCKQWTPKGVCQVTIDIKYGNGQQTLLMDRPLFLSVQPIPSNSRYALAVRFGALDPEGSLSGNEHHLIS